MPRDKHGFEWDPDGWKQARLARRREREANKTVSTDLQNAWCSWHLKQNMLKRFGFRSWMKGVVHPDELQFDEHGMRVPGKRTLSDDHTIVEPPKPPRKLRH